MHAEIGDFASRQFYDGQLETIQNTKTRNYRGPLHWFGEYSSEVVKQLSSCRMLFFDTDGERSAPWRKTNDLEAECVAWLLHHLQRIESEPSIGVITPFRAQIANIKDRLDEEGIESSNYNIDTVERYQGSARDIVILSTVISHPIQLSQIVSTSDEGIDRKLNVAITRSREQFILVGARSALEAAADYRELIKQCKVIALSEWREAGATIG